MFNMKWQSQVRNKTEITPTCDNWYMKMVTTDIVWEINNNIVCFVAGMGMVGNQGMMGVNQGMAGMSINQQPGMMNQPRPMMGGNMGTGM